MPNLEKINSHIQKQLERYSLDEVTAKKAARWLDDAGLLSDRKDRRGMPLRRLMRKGLIAGQQQRPNTKGGHWFVCRLNKSK